MILRPLTLATTSGPGLLLEQPIRPAINRLKTIAHRKRACAGERNFTFADNLQNDPAQGIEPFSLSGQRDFGGSEAAGFSAGLASLAAAGAGTPGSAVGELAAGLASLLISGAGTPASCSALLSTERSSSAGTAASSLVPVM